MTPLTSPQVYVEGLSAAGILSIPAGDIVMYAPAVLLILSIIWLSGRHIKTSRTLLRASEKTLESERDSLERRIAERTTALVRAEEQRMMELERNAEFGKLSQGLFHDLIGPLSSVSLYAQELGEQSQYPQKTRDALRVVIESSRRMNSFMESVRRSLGSAETTSDHTWADIQKETSIVKDVLGYKARMAGVEIISEIPEKCVVPIHPVRLHQLLLNLVSNAIDACVEAGEKKHSVTISTRHLKDVVELSVCDTGCGISAENMARMFKQQFTTKTEGSGIGLITIRTIVEQELKGTIDVQSKERVGTTFTIGIPTKLTRKNDAKGFRQLEHGEENNSSG